MKNSHTAQEAAYTIAEAARRTGYDAETLRYYEREGLLRGIGRKGGRRVYTEENLLAINLITCLKKTGMPLKSIHAYMTLAAKGEKTVAKRLAIMRRQQESVVRQLDEMKSFKEHIDFKVWYYETAEREGLAALADIDAAMGRYFKETGKRLAV